MALTANQLTVLDIVVKGLIGAAIAGLITLYGFKIQDARQKEADDTKALQAAIELTSKQKDLDVELGMRMFGTLMSYYFQRGTTPDQRGSVHEQMVLLRLVALNFQDVPIHLKPLFEQLERQLTTPEEHQALRAIAQEVARKQAFRLTVEHGFDSGPLTVTAGQTLRFDSLLIAIHILDVQPNVVKASIRADIAEGRAIGPFSVSYFDIPIVDNTKLGEMRVALLLLESNGPQATLRCIAFPKHFAADRFDIKELSRNFRDKVTP